jgi:hypothetical protein
MQIAARERLDQLHTELEKGERELAQLEDRRVGVEGTMLRISGAIQVLEELLAQNGVVELQPVAEPGA